MREAYHFHCPNCSTPLRVKDPLSLGRQTRCPECRRPLMIADENGELRITVGDPSADLVPESTTGAVHGADSPSDQKLADDPSRTNPARKSATKGASGSKRIERQGIRVPARSSRWSSGPLIAGWLLAGILGLVFVWYAFFEGGKRELPREEVANVETDDVVPPVDGESVDGDSSPESSPEASLHGIGEMLTRQLALEGAFPSGTVGPPELDVERKLSWMAALADRMGDHPPVTWDKPWNDPMNDGFVRRRLHEFQNPSIAALTGADGYPATHFVGVAGVGLDGPTLASSDPHAGIFAYDRQTRLEDIHDGASNTWLVLGVQERLGSWAAGGSPTVRALTQEPYVNGPDGLGTGQKDSMMVLLADGRVQVVSAAADPRVIRSLAAMADGLPAPEDGSGESPPHTVEPADIVTDDEGAMEIAAGDDPPLDPEFAPEETGRKVDPVVALQQPIVRFELTQSRPLSELLPGLAELVGVPIRIEPDDDIKPASLKTPIQLRLQNTTIGAILEGALKPAGLTYRVEADHLRIVPRD